MPETESKRAKQFQYLVQSVPDAMIIVDGSGRILHANSLAQELFGYSDSALTGRAVETLVPKSLRAKHRAHRGEFARHPTTRSMGSGTFVATRSDGTELDVEISLSPLLTEEGTIVLAAVRDVSELKRAQSALERAAAELERTVEEQNAELLEVSARLRQQIAQRLQADTASQTTEESYRQLVEAQPNLICRFLPDTTLTFANAAFANFFGRTTQDLVGRCLGHLMPGPVQEKVWSELGTCTPAQPLRQYEHAARRADGTLRWHLWNDLALFDAKKKLVGFQSVGIDITERREAELARYSLEARYAGLLEALPLGLHTYRQVEDGRLVLSRANAASDRILGTDRVQLIGKSLEDALSPWRGTPVPENCRGVISAGIPWVSDEVALEEDGGKRLVYVHAFQIADGELAVVFADVTESRRAEDALVEKARQMTAILNNIPDIAWLKDEQSRFIAVNDSFGAACGMSADDLVDKNDLDIWPKELADSYRADDNEVMRTGKRKRVEERLVSSVGRESWIETIKTPIANDLGEIIGTTGIARDITERKRAEAALRESEERFRQIAENIREVFYISVLDEPRMLYVSPGYEAIWQRSRENLYQNPLSFLEAVAPKDRERVSRSLERQLAGERTEESYRIVRPDGTMRWIWDRAFPLRNESGKVYRVTGIAEDITERKEAEEALFAEKERAQVTLHSIGDAVITTDFEGTVEYLNPVAEALTGWNTGEARGRSLDIVFSVVDERTHEPVEDPVARCLRAREVLGFANPSVLVRRDGHQFDIEYSAAPISGRDGRIFGVVLVFHDVSERRLMIRQMAHDAAHDSLTGLANRREFERRLERALAGAKEHAVEHALCYLDLDQFKIINDTAGHAAGDELLKRVKHLLAESFRERDTLARLGGDEFGLLLEHCPLEQAKLVTKTVIDALRDHRFIWKGRTFQVGASIGIVPITAQSESVGQLLSQADVACYTAKEQGRARIHVYEHADSEPAQRHSELLRVSGLRDALDQDRFRLYRQPIEPLTGDEAGPPRYELLLRLLDEKGNYVLPGAFIPAAERYGLIARIDRWVIRTALTRYQDWFGKSGAKISINLSGNSLSENSFETYVEEQLAASAVAAEQVCFEITETAVVHNLSQAIKFITAVRKWGVEVALDDFGSGLSSFRYLKALPVEYLKIDGTFVQDMIGDESNRAIVHAINDVGRAMGIKTIAEYACSPEIVDGLKTIGVDYAQGYALGAPVPCPP